MERFQGVLEASPDAVLVIDQAGVIQQANRNVSDVLGYDPTDIEGMVVEELLLEADREHHVDFRQEYMADPEPRPMGRELDLYALGEDGTEIPVEISLGPVERAGDRYVIATITDITDRQAREQELTRQNERLEEFASIVSHDLRSPLTVAQGRIELARAEHDSDHLETAADAIDRSLSLIEELLTLAREGERVGDVEPVDLAATTRASWRHVETAEATLHAETDRTIRADRSQLQELLENLLRNAVDHGGDDVTVTVDDLDPGFYIADDGPGIPDTERDQVFDPGYSTDDDGTGFGLNIVEEITDAHDWDIDITESDAGGARFEITNVEFAEE